INQGTTLSIFEKNDKIFNPELKTHIKDIIKENLISKKTEEFYKFIMKQYDEIFDSREKLRSKTELLKLRDTKEQLLREIDILSKKIETLNNNNQLITDLENEINLVQNQICEKNDYLIKLEDKKKFSDKLQNITLQFKIAKEVYFELLKNEDEFENINKKLPQLYFGKKRALEKELTEIEENLKNYNILQNQLKQKDELINSSKLTDSLMNEIEFLLQETDKIEIKLNAQNIKVSVTPLKDLTLDIKCDDKIQKEYYFNEKIDFRFNNHFNIDYKDNLLVDIEGNMSKNEYIKATGDLKSKKERLNEIYNIIGVNDINKIRSNYSDLKNIRDEKKVIDINLKNINVTKANFDKNKISNQLEVLNTKNNILSNCESTDVCNNNKELIDNDISKFENRLEFLLERKKNILKEKDSETIKQEYLSLKNELETLEQNLSNIEPKSIQIITDEILKKTKFEIDSLILQKNNKEKQKIALESSLLNIDEIINSKNQSEYNLKNIIRNIKTEEIKINSILLLKKLMEKSKNSLDESILIPLQEKITKLFSDITDNRYQNVVLSNDFNLNKLESKLFDDSLNSLSIDSISYGTKEQLSFLFRFAIASYISEKEPQIMVLDDSFVNTDKNRLKFLLELLKKYSNKVQFLIFSCKDDYNDYKEFINVIDLEKII
ncbi:MAG TPA: hypothetical protein PK771_11130, partial [Spirochaetota bacterium]|nr:hypothetical protein [Spirochaetota bacterium]